MKKFFLLLFLSATGVLSAKAQDFVHLDWYKADNLQRQSPARVVFIGDSITEGWPEMRPDFFSDGVVGRGIGGEVSAQILLRFRQDVLGLHPQVVVINAGTNDIAQNKGEYNEDYAFGNIVTMAVLAREAGIQPVLTSVLPAAGYRWRPEVTDAPEKIAALNARIKSYAQAQGILYLDYYAEMIAPDGRSMGEGLSVEGCHPNEKGYEVMEAVVTRSLDVKR